MITCVKGKKAGFLERSCDLFLLLLLPQIDETAAPFFEATLGHVVATSGLVVSIAIAASGVVSTTAAASGVVSTAVATSLGVLITAPSLGVLITAASGGVLNTTQAASGVSPAGSGSASVGACAE